MAKLDPVKIAWIIREMERDDLTQEQIAQHAGITARYVRIRYARYLKTGTVPILQMPVRSKSINCGSFKCIITTTHLN